MALASNDSFPLPLLITGVAGVAGYNALQHFRNRFPGQVIGIRQKNNWPLAGPGIEPCNAEDADTLGRLFDRYQFRSVLDCAGNCALKSCELDPDLAWRTNVEGVRNLLEIIAGTETRLLHLSIDLVFSGTGRGDHLESDFTDPVTEYGHSMAAAERLILLSCPSACILRISLPMGISHSGHAGAIDWIQWRFKNAKPATLYYDEVRTPSYTDCMNHLFEEVLGGSLHGLYHAGGPRRLSLYEIAQIVNVVGGYDPKLLHGCYRKQAGPIPPRAGNVTLDSSKLTRVLGYQPLDPWPLDDSFVPTDRDWHSSHHRTMQGTPELLANMLYRNRSRNRKRTKPHKTSQLQ
jgi:dTDP-4-dehydrorhamnose reductase